MLVRIQQKLLKTSYVIFRLSWPARSPDLSPVEHVWDQLKRQMPSCHSVHDLELAVQDLWAHLPQDNIRKVQNGLPISNISETGADALCARSRLMNWGCGSPVVKVSNHGRHVMSSIPVPLKTRRVGQRCTLNLSRAETSSRWCGVVVRRGGASSGVVHVT
ncbi:transposable element Tcb2 transposase [Trichonephila clavipes]|nr:transposable element Tcb2 transposase [Trichonephila clavipes]